MKVFVPVNNKGGVGKTRIAAMFAEYSAKILNKKALLIDFDPQCNLSMLYLNMETDPAAPEGYIPPIHPDFSSEDNNRDWDGRSTIADLFYPELSSHGILPYPTYIDNLEISPAHSSKLEDAKRVLKSEVKTRVHERLEQFLSLDEVQESYDLVVIDTAPSKCPLTLSAIHAATDLVIPSIMEDKPIQGIQGMMQRWMQERLQRPKNKPINLRGIIANLYDSRTSLHKQLFNDLKTKENIGPYLLNATLGRRIAFAEVDSTNASPRSIFDYPETDKARIEADQVFKILAEGVFADV